MEKWHSNRCFFLLGDDFVIRKKTVWLAYSGGIDSTYALYRLQKDGFQVYTITMRLLGEKEPGYEGEQRMLQEARKIAGKMGTEHHEVDGRTIFEEKVKMPFLLGYRNGQTPNPCILCNRHLKFGLLYEEAMRKDADFYATGHYAVIQERQGKKTLIRPQAKEKDQTYYLHCIEEEKLGKILFPLSQAKSKSSVKEEVNSLQLPIREKQESMGICFIPKGSVGRYNELILGKMQQGYFVNQVGCIMGKHRGLCYYTIGQKVTLISGENGVVTKIDPNRNRVKVGGEQDILFKTAIIHEVIFSRKDLMKLEGLYAKIGQWSIEYWIECILQIDEKTYEIKLKDVAKGMQAGQALVVYYEDMVCGGGIIQSVF